MTSKIFKDYLKSLFPEFKYTLGIEDKSIPKLITIYNRAGTAGFSFYGNREDNIQILPLTLIVSVNDNYSVAEEEANRVYNGIVYNDEVKFKDFTFSIFSKANILPVYLGRTEEGIYQFSLDIDVIYNK